MTKKFDGKTNSKAVNLASKDALEESKAAAKIPEVLATPLNPLPNVQTDMTLAEAPVAKLLKHLDTANMLSVL